MKYFITIFFSRFNRLGDEFLCHQLRFIFIVWLIGDEILCLQFLFTIIFWFGLLGNKTFRHQLFLKFFFYCNLVVMKKNFADFFYKN